MKKLLTGGIVAGAMLVAPAVAGAVVVPNTSYAGTFTTGTGGTVEFVVNEAGTEVDFSTPTAFGQVGCDGNTIGRDDLVISNDSFSFFDGGPPLVSINGFFGEPGVATGTARISGVCDSGVQSWTAEAPVVWPDGYLEHASLGFAGENVYNSTGANQAITQKVRQRKLGRFLIHVENDGTESDGIDVTGCGSSKGFKVTYTQGGDNVTNQVKSGTYQTASVDTGESETLRLQVKVARKAKPGKTKSCKVTMSHSGTFRGAPPPPPFEDAVKAQIKVKRSAR